jgi:signal transduction histidine kinase
MGARGATVTILDLLMASELIAESDVVKALPLSRNTGLPLSRILVELQIVTEKVARAAVIAQVLLQDNMLHVKLAATALRMVRSDGVTLEGALKTLGWRSQYYEHINKLGDLLVSSQSISEEQLKAGFEVSFSSGLPLLRVLILRQDITAATAQAALDAQVLLKEGSLDFERACGLIVGSRAGPDDAGIIQFENRVRLGRLLVHAGAVSEIDLVSAVEMSIASEQPIGRVLVNNGVITEEVLERGLALQKQLNARAISWQEAHGSLQQGKFHQRSARSALEDLELSQLMHAAGLTAEEDLPSMLRELILQKQNLSFKIVSQHEEIRTNLARELHDTVIADLMMLKRYLSGDKELSRNEILEITNDVIRQLRDICYDSLPRQLQDLGLQASLKDLMERMQARTHIDCRFSCQGEIPSMSQPVNLHIFRIAQECLNNAEKYSNAREVSLAVKRDGDKLVFTITDDGKGFDQDSVAYSTTGGTGIGSLQERRDLIRVYYPAELHMHSSPGHGSRFVLELTVVE